jgi:hypothetical protein
MRKIRVDQIGDYSEEQVNALLSVVVLTADRIVKEGSPVDTGRLAVSWQIGENAESGAPAKEGKYGAEGLGTVVRPPKTLNYQLGKENFRKKYNLHNNVPYAEPVMLGTSLPPSWGGSYRSKQGLKARHLDLLAKEIAAEVDDLYRQIRGK